MFKLFTLAGANEMLTTVDARLQTLQDARAALAAARDAYRDVKPGTAEAYAANQDLAFLARSVQDARRDVAHLGVQVPDLDAGIVEFPSRIGGEVVHLVWQRGEDAIHAYHRLTGDLTPRPLHDGDAVNS